MRVLTQVLNGVSTAARLGRKGLLALGMAALGSASIAQTVPDAEPQTPPAGLDLPANLQIFGKADPNIRKPTAIVNDVVITGTDVDQRVALLLALNNAELSSAERDQMRLQVLRQLIDETLEIQEAKANKIDVTKADIDHSFDRVSQNFNRTPEELRAWLKQVGSSERSMRRQIEGELNWNRLLSKNVEINVSDSEVAAIIARLQAQKGSDEYHPYEIYLGASADRSGEVFAAEKRMIDQMKSGTPFEYLARNYSESSTRAQGGDLGWLRAPMLPDALAHALEIMEVGQIAGPIEVPGGFSILYLADKRKVLVADPRDATFALKQITITFPAGTTQAQATARASELATATQAMKGCGDAAKTAAAMGGEVVDNDAIKIRQLPPALQNMLLPLQIGQATQPFGAVDSGVRVLVVCGREDPVDNSTPSADVIQRQLEEQRTNLRAQRMLRDLRRDALVEYR
ncbi:MAG: peptidylprolyl isomerase [Sphingomonas sp.]